MKLNGTQHAEVVSPVTSAVNEVEGAVAEDPIIVEPAKDDAPVFKVQFLSSSKKLAKGDSAFKGLAPVEHYYDRGLYKYIYGASADYNEILRIKRKVNEKFKDAFIVAFVKGERIDTQKAIAMFKQNNP